MTNEEKFKQMVNNYSIKELTGFISELSSSISCKCCVYSPYNSPKCEDNFCVDGIMTWLEQESDKND